jgi:hypothetical protein
MTDLLTIWVIYRSPSDYPGKWVLRGHDIGPGSVTSHAKKIVADTLQELRAHLPPGLVPLTLHPDDDPVIYETWL